MDFKGKEFKGYFRKVSNLLQGSFNSVPRVIQEKIKGVSMEFKVGFKCV